MLPVPAAAAGRDREDPAFDQRAGERKSAALPGELVRPRYAIAPRVANAAKPTHALLQPAAGTSQRHGARESSAMAQTCSRCRDGAVFERCACAALCTARRRDCSRVSLLASVLQAASLLSAGSRFSITGTCHSAYG